MSRVFWIVLGMAMAAATAWPRAATQTTPASASAPILYDRYAGGDFTAPATTFRTSRDFQHWHEDLITTARAWQGAWRPSQVTFLLEVSTLALERGWDGGADVLAAGRDLAMSRPDTVHWYPIADAFEVKVHRTALAMLVGLGRLELATSYLATIHSRIHADASDNPRDIVDPRISLTAAVLADLRTAPANLPGAHEPDQIPSLLVDQGQAMARRLLQLAERAYAEAQRHPSVAAEAATRRALVLHRLGRQREALDALDQADASPADPTVRYWTSLFRGRVLETLGRLDEARTAYERAATIWPGAQTPVVALAALLQRQGRVAEAIRAAEAARTTPAGTVDPWWQYWSGDLRFFDQWLGELRKVRP